MTGTDISPDMDNTYAIVLGDVNGDGDLDVVAGNGLVNRLYQWDAVADTFMTGTDITADASSTRSVQLGDVDGDGDLDLVTGNINGQANRLYEWDASAGAFVANYPMSRRIWIIRIQLP